MTNKQQRANQRAREAGFRNDYEYRKARAGLPPAIRNRVDKAGLRGRALKDIAALHYFGDRGKGPRGARGAGFSIPRKGSKERAKFFGRLAAQLRRAGINPGPILKAIGSPKRKQAGGIVPGQEGSVGRRGKRR